MRLPLNIPYSVGTDLAFAPRFLTLDTPNWVRFQKLSRRLLTASEYESFKSRHKFHETAELSSGSASRAQAIIAARNYVAGRWAAKEAAMKAWGADLLSPQQLQVDIEKDGRPTIHCFLPEDVDAPEEQITSQEANLAISHDGEYATAIVIARPLHPELRKAFVKLRLEGRSRVAGKPKVKTEIDDSKRDFFPKNDPAFNNIIDLDNDQMTT